MNSALYIIFYEAARRAREQKKSQHETLSYLQEIQKIEDAKLKEKLLEEKNQVNVSIKESLLRLNYTEE